MFHLSQLASQLISLFALGVYIAAAFLPCEPTPGERSALATALTAKSVHAVQVSEPVVPVPVTPAKVATVATHDHGAHHHHNGGHDHGAQAKAAAPSRAEAHASDRIPTRLSMKAKCICGCDRTRSLVGGGAARLGSVVLTAVPSGLPPAPVIVPEDRLLTRWVEVHFEDDQVPI